MQNSKKRNTKNFSNYFSTIKVSKVSIFSLSQKSIHLLFLYIFFIKVGQKIRASTSQACTSFIVARVSRIHPRVSGSLLLRTHILLIIAASLEDPPDTTAAVSRALVASRRVSDSICTRTR